jgi:Flp pilus assembly protein TadD/4-amino-4-deoxy-L-arabinose transferase-like glycosyltransferase
MGKNRIPLLFIVLMLSLAVRLFYFFQLKDSAIFGFYAGDSIHFDKFAQKILAGDLIFKESIYLGQAYPFILSFIYLLFGHNIEAVVLCQVFLDVITTALIYFICLNLFGRRSIGLLASFIYSIYAPAVFYAGFMMDMTFSAFFFASFTLVTLIALEKKNLPLWSLSGAVLGALTLFRSPCLALIPAVILWLTVWRGADINKKVAYSTLFCLGILAVVLPFSVRNYMIEKTLSPFAPNGGISFYIGNHAGASGMYETVEGISDSPVDQVKTSVRKAEAETGRKMTLSEASSHWFLKGADFIKRDPMQYMLILMKKISLFWNRVELASNENMEFCKNYVPILKLPLLSFGIIAPFAILGIFFAFVKGTTPLRLAAVISLTYMIAVTIFFVSARYRFPVMPLIIVIASYAVNEFFILAKGPEKRKLFPCVMGFVLAFLYVNKALPEAYVSQNLYINHNNLGVNYYEKGALDKAVGEYKKGIELNPEYAPLYNNLAGAYHGMGDDGRSEAAYLRSIELAPDFAQAHYGLANVYEKMGRYDKAVEHCKRAVELDADFIEAYNNLGYLYAASGRTDEAEKMFARAIKIDGKYAKAYNNLGILYAKDGRTKEASGLFEKALSLDPGYADARKNLSVLRGRIKDGT